MEKYDNYILFIPISLKSTVPDISKISYDINMWVSSDTFSQFMASYITSENIYPIRFSNTISFLYRIINFEEIFYVFSFLIQNFETYPLKNSIFFLIKCLQYCF